jgi:hypothetical protein
MRKLVLLIFILVGCSTPKQGPHEMILGSWQYLTAERLGDGSQNDKASIAEFDKTMNGKVLIFYKDSTYKSVSKNDGNPPILRTGKYSIATDGASITMDNQESTKLNLTDSIFKVYSPNNGIFVFRKLKE